MITITDDNLGTFEGDTLKDAQRSLRKAQRAKSKQDAIDHEHRKTALHRAEAVAYRVLKRKIEDGAPPSGWRFYAAGHKYGPHLKEHRDIAERVYHEMDYETEWGRGTLDHYGYRVAGHVWNGGGHTIAVFFEDNAGLRPMACCAVGCCEGQIVLADLPGITPEWFERDEEAAAA